jgi:O-antigen/teichoic acid export membrane protein
MTDLRGMGGHIGVVGSGRGFYVLSLFVLNIGLARSMGAEGFGAFQQVFMFSAFFTVLTLGIPETVYFFLPRLTAEERPGFLGQTVLLLAASGTALFFVFLFGAPLLSGVQGNPSIAGNLRIFGLYGGCIVASAFADPIFIIFRRVRFLFALSMLHGLFFIGITVWQYTSGAGAEMLFAAMAAFAACKFALSLVLVYRMRPLFGEIHYFRGKHMLLLQLSFALPIALSTTVDIVSTWLDKFVVSVYLGKEALGIFYVGAIEIPFVAVLLTSVYSVVSPVLNSLHHHQDGPGFADLVKKTFLFTATLIWPLWLYLFVFADRLIPLVFGAGYEASVLPFRIYLAMMPLRIALYGVIVIALGKPRIVLVAAAGVLLLNLALNIILVTRMGLAGPATATVISSYAHVAVLLWVIMRESGTSLAGILPLRGLLGIGATAAVSTAAGIAIAATGALENDAQMIGVSLAVFIGVYLFIGTRTGIITIPNLGEIMKGRGGGGSDDSRND